MKHARHLLWGIIADDLTGATDVAAAFANSGFASVVVLNRRRTAFPEAQVIVLSSDSRHDPPAAARRNVQRAFAWLNRRKIPLIYKKLDSTWKGNIAVEVSALRDAAGMSSALVCPANPAQGRIVRNTVLSVNGREVANLSDSLASSGRTELTAVGQPVTTAKIARAIRQHHRFIVADAATVRDLACLAAAVLRTPGRILLAGSAAMAAELAKLLAQRRGLRPSSKGSVWQPRSASPSSSSKTKSQPAPRTKAPPAMELALTSAAPSSSPAGMAGTLILVGSRNPVTENQIDWLRRRGQARIFDFNRRKLGALQSCLAGAQIAVVRVPIHVLPDRTVLRSLAACNAFFRQRFVSSLVLTGGDTACLVCRWLGVQAIQVQGEILPGLAWGRIMGGLANELAVCTKPGGFGEVDALQRAIEFLAGSRSFTPDA